MAGAFIVITKTDKNQMKGTVINGVPSILAGPKKMPLATKTLSKVTVHPGPVPPIHPVNPIDKNCSKSVIAGPTKQGVAFKGSIDMCKHTMIGPGVKTVLVGK